jgi:hypothetical protein
MSHFAETGESSNTIDKIQTVGTKSVTAADSKSPSSTASSTKADQEMAKKQILNLYEYWKVPMVIDMGITNFHECV